MTDLDARLGAALEELPLKEMEGALLAAALLRAVEPLDDAGAVRRAVDLAAYAHRDATRGRRGPLPRDSYITHPLRGALRLHRWGCATSTCWWRRCCTTPWRTGPLSCSPWRACRSPRTTTPPPRAR